MSLLAWCGSLLRSMAALHRQCNSIYPNPDPNPDSNPGPNSNSDPTLTDSQAMRRNLAQLVNSCPLLVPMMHVVPYDDLKVQSMYYQMGY